MSKSPIWYVNYFHAAACVSAAEINRKMLEVFNTTDDFSKLWNIQDPHLNHKGIHKPRWTLKASAIDAPYVSYATTLKNGANLLTQIKTGSFSHEVLSDDDAVKHEEISLNGVVFSIQTDMAGITHYATGGTDGGTIDKQFTVQALYADLDNPSLLSSINTSYELNSGSFEYLTGLGITAFPASVLAIVQGSSVVSKIYPLADAFWDAFNKSLSAADQATVKPHKTTIIKAAHLAFSSFDDTGRSIATVLLDLYQGPTYNKKGSPTFVFGTSKIPVVTATKGPFTPRSMRFSVFQDPKDATIGSINWNLMVAATLAKGKQLALPSDTHASAGQFDENPIPTGKPGTMIISYGKTISELILATGFNSMGLPSAMWNPPSDTTTSATATLNQDVALDTSGMDSVSSGTFKNGTCSIYPDLTGNQIKVDFEISDMVYTAKWYDFLKATPGLAPVLAILSLFDEPTYKATWSSYITFSVDTKNGTLLATFTSDTPNISIQDQSTPWRIIGDIASLGLNELDRVIDKGSISSDISNYVSSNSKEVLDNILSSVEMPGGAVFTFDDDLDWYYLGLRIGLKYK